MNEDEADLGVSATFASLSRVRLDALLEELLQRVGGVLDAQERLQGLLDAVVAIASDLSIDGVLEEIVRVASKLADAEYAALGVLGSGPDRRLRQFITFGLTAEQREAIGDLPRGKGILGHIIDHPEPLRLTDLHAHQGSYGFPPNHPPMNSFLGVPIRIRDKLFGNLYLTEKRGGGSFTTEDEEIVIALAAAAGVVIENARLYEEAARRQAWLEAAAEISNRLLGHIEREDALQLVADRARAVASADLALVLLRAGEETLRIEVVSGHSGEGAVGSMVAIPGSVSGAVVSSGDTLVLESASDGQSTGDFAPPPDWPSLGPVMLLPLHTDEQVEGVLIVGWSSANADAFHDVDVTLPAAFAEQAALALRVARAQEDQALLAVFEDRDRIGRDLHDLVIQRLFAIGLALENTSRLVDKAEAATRIGTAVDDIDATIKDIRRSIFELSAPSDSGDLRREVASALDNACAGLGFRPTLRMSGPVDAGVPAGVRPQLIAVLVEALSNATRHAHASSIGIDLAVGDEVVLEIADDGVGFDPAAAGRRSGLHNLVERAEALGGSCRIVSAAGRGTTIRWRVPRRTAP